MLCTLNKEGLGDRHRKYTTRKRPLRPKLDMSNTIEGGIDIDIEGSIPDFGIIDIEIDIDTVQKSLTLMSIIIDIEVKK